jgi:hypothetical protein
MWHHPSSHSTAVARNPLLLLRSNTPRVTHASQPPSRRRSHTTSAARTPWPCGREGAPTPAPAFACKPPCRAPGDRKPRPTPMSTLFQAETAAGSPESAESHVDVKPDQGTKERRKSKRRQTGSTAPATEHEKSELQDPCSSLSIPRLCLARVGPLRTRVLCICRRALCHRGLSKM